MLLPLISPALQVLIILLVTIVALYVIVVLLGFAGIHVRQYRTVFGHTPSSRALSRSIATSDVPLLLSDISLFFVFVFRCWCFSAMELLGS
jgi:hypothetical protein